MPENRKLAVAGKGVLETITPLVDNLFRVLKTQESDENDEKKSAMAKAFTVALMCLTEKYFAEANYALHRWLETRPLPEIRDNELLMKAKEKLERKLKRMEGKKYRERFYFEWEENIGFDGKTNIRRREEFDGERYKAEKDKVFKAIESAEKRIEADTKRRLAEKLAEELEILFGNVLNCFNIVREIERKSENLMPNPELPAGEISDFDRSFLSISHIILTANIEHFIPFLKRACAVLEVQAKKFGRWDERGLALGRFLLSLKSKVAEYEEEGFDKGFLTDVYDGLLIVELFLVETYDSIVQRQKEKETQREFQQMLKRGFDNLTQRLSDIERGIIATNRHLAGIDGRLVDMLRVNENILKGIEKNGLRLDGISQQIGEMSDRFDLAMQTLERCLMDEAGNCDD